MLLENRVISIIENRKPYNVICMKPTQILHPQSTHWIYNFKGQKLNVLSVCITRKKFLGFAFDIHRSTKIK